MRAGIVALASVLAGAACGRGVPVVSGPSDAPQVGGPETVPDAVYVSPQGDDGRDGRSPEAALASIAKALRVARPGETVLLLSGSYHQQVEIEEALAGPVTLRGPAGSRPVLDGQRRLRFGLKFWEARGLAVSGLEIRHYTDEGLGVYGARDVILRDLRVHDNGFANQDPELDGEGFGIDLEECAGVLVEGVEAFANGPAPATRARGVFGTGLNTYGNRDVTIRGNHLHHNIGGGLLVEDSVRITVEDNLIEANDVDNSPFNYWDAGLWLDGGREVVVRRNTFRGNLGPGIQVSDEDRQRPTGHVLEGNVSSGNYFGIFVWNFGACPFPPAHVLQVSGNDFSRNSRQDVLCEE